MHKKFRNIQEIFYNRGYKFLLGSIVFLAFFLRVWQLGNVPPSPNWDEVALGYNAYSILHTGKDEYGKFLPVVLRSYDDYKPGIYVYFVMPFILLFNLTSFAVRFPSAIFGTVTVLATFFLIKELFKNEGGEKDKNRSVLLLGLISSFLLAISPWHIQFSRIAFESNVGVAWNVLAVLLFLKGLRRPLLLPLAAFCFGIIPSIYQSDKVFSPLLFLSLVIIFFSQLRKVPMRYLFASIIVGVITLSPLLYFHATDKQALARAQGVSIFSDQTAFLQDTARRLIADREANDIIGLIFDNRRVEFFKAVASGYISHFDLNWLFIHGDLPRHHAPFMGLLYLWELPFLFIGIYMLTFKIRGKKTKILLFSWFLLAPIPASITSGVPHAVRTLNFLPTFQIFIALGLIGSYTFFQEIKASASKLVIVCASTLYLFFSIFLFAYFLNQYFMQQNYYTSIDWQYGYREAVVDVKKIEKDYRKIVVTNKPPLDQSYMFFLFYLRYPPSAYQIESIKNSSGGFRENHAFGKYEFRPIDWEHEEKSGSTLYIGRPEDFPSSVKVRKTIRYLDGTDAIKVVSL